MGKKPSLKITGTKALENGWLEYDLFLSGPGLFSGVNLLLVSGSVLPILIDLIKNNTIHRMVNMSGLVPWESVSWERTYPSFSS